jgi:phosphate transport system protein
MGRELDFVGKTPIFWTLWAKPLAGYDLRFLSSIPSIAADLERIGDHAAGITRVLLLMAGLLAPNMNQRESRQTDQKPPPSQTITEDSIVSGLLALGQEACQVLQGTVDAFQQGDAHTARKIWQEDDVVDVRYHLVRHDLMTMLTSIYAIPALQQDSHILQRMTYWFWIAHKLERIGDHCTNVCERIVFFLEGDWKMQPTQAE